MTSPAIKFDMCRHSLCESSICKVGGSLLQPYHGVFKLEGIPSVAANYIPFHSYDYRSNLSMMGIRTASSLDTLHR